MLRYFTTGESHGEALTAVLSGVPAGLKIDLDWKAKKDKKGLRQPFDSPFELRFDLCFQQNVYGGWGSG